MPDVNTFYPYSAQQAEIDRRRRMAQLLQAQGMEPLTPPSIPGVQTSNMEGLARLLQTFLGRRQENKLDIEQRGLAARKQADMQSEMARLLASQGGTQRLQVPGVPGIAGSSEAYLPPDPSIAAASWSSQFPEVRQLQAILTGQQMEGARAREQRDFTTEERRARERFEGGENAITHALSRERMAQELAIANRPQFQHFGTATGGIIFGRTDPQQGTFTKQGEIAGAPLKDTHVGGYVNKAGKQIEIFQKPDGSSYEKEFGEVRPPLRNEVMEAIRAINLQNLTTAAPGQLIFRSSGNPVPTTQVGDVASQRISAFNSTLQQADIVEDLLNKIGSSGAIKGFVLREGIYWPVAQDNITPDQAAAISEVQRLVNSYLYAVSGKQINENEFVRIQRTAPDLRFTPESNKTVITHFKRYVQSERDNYLKVRGWALKEEESKGNALDDEIIRLLKGGK